MQQPFVFCLKQQICQMMLGRKNKRIFLTVIDLRREDDPPPLANLFDREIGLDFSSPLL